MEGTDEKAEGVGTEQDEAANLQRLNDNVATVKSKESPRLKAGPLAGRREGFRKDVRR